MKIVLITPNSPGRYYKAASPPVGIAYLATVLKKLGHDVNVMDLRIEERRYDYISAIKGFSPDLVGVSFMSYYYRHSYQMIDEIKEKLGVTVVVGGPHPSTIKEKILEECKADYAVYGEGEVTLTELAEKKDPSCIKGLIWRNGKTITVNPPREFILQLDSLPFPDYRVFALDKYTQKRIPLNTARGCPHRCIYCAVELVSGKRFRARSYSNVVDEVELWYRRGYRNFGFNDDTFTENIKRAEQICDEIIKRGINIEWDLRTGIRADRVNRQLLEKLKKAGCNFIVFGIESFDPYVLDMMHKDITPAVAEEAIAQVKKAGISTGGFFMIGTPGDTYESFRKTYEFASRDAFDEVRFYNTVPYPGTGIYEWIRENGKFLLEPEEYLNSCERWEEDPIFETEDFPAEQRIRAFNKGEHLVVKKLVVKVMGKWLGALFYLPCKIKFIRRLAMGLGFRLAPALLMFLDIKRKILSRAR